MDLVSSARMIRHRRNRPPRATPPDRAQGYRAPVRHWLTRLREPGIRVDAALVALIVALTVVESLTADGIDGPGAVIVAVVGVAMAAAILWRRRRPLAAAVATAVLLTVAIFAWEVADNALYPTLVIGVAGVLRRRLLRPARRDRRRRRVARPDHGPSVGVQQGFEDFVFILVMLGGVWVAGRPSALHREQAVELADARAAVEREAEANRVAAVAEERAADRAASCTTSSRTASA